MSTSFFIFHNEKSKKNFCFEKQRFLMNSILIVFFACDSLFQSNKKRITREKEKIKYFPEFQVLKFLVYLKHILQEKELVLLFFLLFVSMHFYEYFFLILMYVFVNLK
jgi:hypothetical protein